MPKSDTNFRQEPELSSPVAQTDLVGSSFGQYRITELLGAGDMGVVWRAEDTRLGREIALKILSTGSAASPDARERFRREARTVAALNHPNIVQAIDVGESGGYHYFVMECIDGCTVMYCIIFPDVEMCQGG